MTPNSQFSLALQPLADLKFQPYPAPQSQPVPAASSLRGALADISPLPREALLLGIASDGLPVLLNLHDPHPGPVLIVGEAGAGKTAFLQSIARSVVQTHKESEVQFGVVTNRMDEWGSLDSSQHCVGIFDINQTASQELILSLASWAHSNKNTQQSVLLLIDDLVSVAKLEPDVIQSLRWLLLRGPARRVWPLITLNADRHGQVLAWIETFRTRIFGRIENAPIAEALGGDQTAALDRLEAGRQFSLRENGYWLQFSLPIF